MSDDDHAELERILAPHRWPGRDAGEVLRSLTDDEIARVNALGVGREAIGRASHCPDGRDAAQRIVDHVDAHGPPGGRRNLVRAVGWVTDEDIEEATRRINQRSEAE